MRLPFSNDRNAAQSSTSTTVPSNANPISLPQQPTAVAINSIVDHSEEDDGNLESVPITLRTVVMALLVAMGGFIFGYDTGQISGFLEMGVFLRRFGQPTTDLVTHPSGFHFTNIRSGLIVGLLSIGTLIGCLVAGPLANKYGRKYCIPGWCIVFCVGVVAEIAVGAGAWVGIAMGRCTAGLGIGGLSVLVPLYMSETSPVPVRGAVVACYQLFITIGIFTADCINYGTEHFTTTASYRIPMGVGFIWAIILGFGILFLPETPRHDWNRGRSARATTTMSKFYGLHETHSLIKNETAEIEKAMRATRDDQPWYKTFRGQRIFYRVALAMTLQMLQQLTGANYFFYYGTRIFKGVGIKNSYVTAMIFGGVNVGATFFGVYMARRCRRRESLYIAALWQFMCFLIFASVGKFVFKDAAPGSPTNKTAGAVMVVFACLFLVGYATTWGPLVWACNSEMFPYKYRAVGMGCATSANWFWNFMLAFCTPFITSNIQYAYGYVFAGCNLAAFFMVYFFLLESSGRTLEEVDGMYRLNVPPRHSAKFKFSEEELQKLVEERVNTDSMHLQNGGRKKVEEGGHGSVFQHEEKKGEQLKGDVGSSSLV